jgi:putative ABC transport system permease protein
MKDELQPPQWIDRVIDTLAPPELAEEIRGDLYESFKHDLTGQSHRRANRNYIFNGIGFLFRRFFWRSSRITQSNSFSMINNYFLIAWRHLLKNKMFYVINIFGLSVGLACALLIGSYIYSELTYDTYPENAENIYRVEVRALGNGNWVEYSNVDYGVGSGMADAYPEIVSFTRISRGYAPYLHYNDIVSKEENIALVDSVFLDFFSLPLLSGNSKTALAEPNQIVVSAAFAKKYFGDDDPMDKILTVGTNTAFKVTGVFDKIPDRSHFHFDALLSQSTVFRTPRESWSNIGIFTYLQLSDGADAKALENKFPDLVKKHVVPEIQADMGVSREEAEKAVNTFVFSLRPLRDIHLGSHTSNELGANGDIKYVYILGALAMFILLLACVNFINLSTATSTKRAREVGVRKVMGSIKSQLVWQFLTESLLLAFCAMLFAYGIVAAVLPMFGELTGKPIGISFFISGSTILIVVAATFLVGLISGIYPSIFLSSFNTVRVLKGATAPGAGKRDHLRSGLVVFQFAVSSALIVATLVVYEQLGYMQNKDLGYSKDQVLVIKDTRLLRANEKIFRDQVAGDSRVISASISAHMPGEANLDGTQAFAKEQRAKENGSEIHIDIFRVDYDYLATLGISVAYGRNFSRDFPSDSAAVVINQTAAYELGWTPETAIDKVLVRSGREEYRVVGVVNDFNYASPRQRVGPLVMMLRYNRGSILVKLQATDIQSFLVDAKTKWDQLAASDNAVPFSYTFLDEKFDALYVDEERTGRIFTAFASIAIVIAGLGLFGLSTFSAEQRVREIGIRKVLGASAQQVLLMLSKQFMLLVLMAFLIATPLVTWGMNQWLEDFAYRVEIRWWIFVVAAMISFAIAFVSMSVQAVKAAVANPVATLRD